MATSIAPSSSKMKLASILMMTAAGIFQRHLAHVTEKIIDVTIIYSYL